MTMKNQIFCVLNERNFVLVVWSSLVLQLQLRETVALLNFLYTGEKQDNKEHFQWKLKIPY